MKHTSYFVWAIFFFISARKKNQVWFENGQFYWVSHEKNRIYSLSSTSGFYNHLGVPQNHSYFSSLKTVLSRALGTYMPGHWLLMLSKDFCPTSLHLPALYLKNCVREGEGQIRSPWPYSATSSSINGQHMMRGREMETENDKVTGNINK